MPTGSGFGRHPGREFPGPGNCLPPASISTDFSHLKQRLAGNFPARETGNPANPYTDILRPISDVQQRISVSLFPVNERAVCDANTAIFAAFATDSQRLHPETAMPGSAAVPARRDQFTPTAPPITSPMPAWITRSAMRSSGVFSRLTIASLAPLCFASSGNPAAG